MESWRESLKQGWLKQRRPVILLWLLFIPVLFILMRYDHALLGLLTAGWNQPTETVAHFFYTWGDVRGATVIALSIWLAGRLANRASWRQAAILSLVASLVAGAAVNAVRLTAGRVRPRFSLSAEYYPAAALAEYSTRKGFERLPDTFTGPSMEKKRQSFPSAHAGTSFGAATTLAVLVPWVGVPCLGYAAVVGWSRMYKLEHYPSDVATGAMIGITAGLILAAAGARHATPPGDAK